MVVVGEARISVEQLALVRTFDVRLDADESVLAGGVEDAVENLEEVLKRLAAVRIRLQKRQSLRKHRLHGGRCIADDYGAKCTAADDDDFVWLPKDSEVAVVHGITHDHATSDHYHTDDYDHEGPPVASLPIGARLSAPTMPKAGILPASKTVSAGPSGT